MQVAGCGEPLFDGFLHIGGQIGVERGRPGSKRGVRFDGKLVAGKVRGRVAHCLPEVGKRLVERLLRQAVHQVEVDGVEMAQSDLDGAAGFAVVVNAAQRL